MSHLNQMRIAFDSQIFSGQVRGGISRYFCELGRQLNRDDVNFRIFAPLHRNIYLKGINTVSGRYLKNFPKGSASLFRISNHLAARFTMSAWKPDLVHETYFSHIRASLEKKPSVVTVYDMIHELFPNNFPFWNQTVRAKRIACNRVDKIICISESTRRDLLSLYPSLESKTHVIYLGIDTQVFKKKRHQQFRLSKETRPYLLFVGNRAGYKNFHLLLRAYGNDHRLNKSFDLVAFGGGSFSNEEIALIQDFRLIGRVKQVSGDDDLLSSYYRDASLFIYPSVYEGFGLPPLEAMAANCPVLCTKASSIPEVVGKAAQFFEPDIDDLQQAIFKVLNSDEKRKELVRKGAVQIKNFTWEKCAEETLKLYRATV